MTTLLWVGIVPLFFGAWLLGDITRMDNGLLIYDGIMIGAMILLGMALIKLPTVLLAKRKRNHDLLERDGKQLTEMLRQLEDSDLPKTYEPVVLEEPLRLSLDQQYHYVQTMDTEQLHELSPQTQKRYGVSHLTLAEMEQKLKETLNSIHPVFDQLEWETKNWFGDQWQKEHKGTLYEWMRLTVFYEEYRNHFLKKFGQRDDYFAKPHTLTSELKEKLENFQREKEQFKWRILQGVTGENRVVDNIRLLLPEGTILQNVRIEHAGNSAESDVIYIGSTGIYSLEVKNIGTKGIWNIHISRDGQWQQVYDNGNREPMKDMGSQMQYHVAVKERFLNEKLRKQYGTSAPKIKMRGAVVIANDKVMVDNESDLPVYRSSSVVRFIEQGTDEISPEWQERVAAILNESSKEGKPYELPHYLAKMENLLMESAYALELYQLRYGQLEEMYRELKEKETAANVESLSPSRTERRVM